MKNHTIWNLQKISTYCKNPTTSLYLVSSRLLETYSPCVKHLAVFTEKWLCLSQTKASERCCVFILSRWCTATIIQLPSQKQLWLTKQPLPCLAIHAGVVSLQPHRRCAPLTLAFKSTTQANGFVSPLNLPTPRTITHKLLYPPTKAARRSEQCCWVVRCICLSCSGCSVACWKLLNAPSLLKISAAP